MNIIQLLDDFNQRFERDMRKHLPVVGQLSCTTCTQPGCCYQKVIIHVHEALLIADYLVTRKLDTTSFRGSQ